MWTVQQLIKKPPTNDRDVWTSWPCPLSFMTNHMTIRALEDTRNYIM